MFTVLSNTRNSNLYLIAALAIVMIVLLTFAIAPAISAPQPVLIPVTVSSETTSDYFQRHPELKVSAVVATDMTGDFSLRHSEWTLNVPNAAIPVTGMFETSDYFQRHPVLNLSVESAADLTDYFVRHPELRTPNITTDLSDYFLRH
jgi:hypothetical protein